MFNNLEKLDLEVYNIIKAEENRQFDKIRLIASENYTSSNVLNALSSVFTNKYSEGYPGSRYYEGQQNVDLIENLAISRAKFLFQAEHANVQPLSGSIANMAVYFAVLKPGDTIMGLSLPHGGHLTHGWNVSFSGKLYKSCSYFTDSDTGLLNYNEIRKIATENKPKLIIAGASAYSRKIDFAKFREIADEVGAYLLADIAHISGIIAAGLHQNPCKYADFVTSTTHKTLRGPRGGLILSKAKYSKDIDRAVFPCLQGGPHQNKITALAVALKEASTIEFKSYIQDVLGNAKSLAKELQEFGFNIVTGGTDNHIVLVDLRSKKVSGKDMAKAMDKAGIVCNYNSLLCDLGVRGAKNPSGIRLGTPAVTSRSMKGNDMKFIASCINNIANNINNDIKLNEISKKIKEFNRRFIPLGF